MTSRSRRYADRGARWLVTAGGFGIVVSILGILAFITLEILPMFQAGRVHPGEPLAVGTSYPAVLGDEYRSHAAALAADGTIEIFSLTENRSTNLLSNVLEDSLASIPLRRIAIPPGQSAFQAIGADGSVVLIPFRWNIRFEESTRVVEGSAGIPIVFASEGFVPEVIAVRVDDAGQGLAVSQDASGKMLTVSRSVEENIFTEEVEESWSRTLSQAPPMRQLVLDQARQNLYGADHSGSLYWWKFDRGTPVLQDRVDAGAKIDALTLLIGDRSLIAGDENGILSVWFVVRQPDETFRLTRIRQFPPVDGTIRNIAPSLRNKGFAAITDKDQLGLFYSTSHRAIWSGSAPIVDVSGLFFSAKNDGLLLAGRNAIVSLEVENPHPEIGWRSLFGKVWYEGRSGPEYVWQSTGGTDDFEPKLSLTPLIMGTLKGTVFSLFLAIPLAVFGAMYTAQFIHPRLRQTIKPIVEIMASLPSVVLGFLAGLWLAPRVQEYFPALLMMVWILPLLVVLVGIGWHRIPRKFRARFPLGVETLLYMSAIALGAWGCISASGIFERWLFGGDFRSWLLESTGLVYDPLNALVVGLAMGFAVIPIIFSIAEDAFSNVPQNLVSGSLALGANRWQTVTRVVLPTASPGIFSAIMIGFGRAIGETMIVVMATGNTPIMSWSPFNGFRTLSANIAVEIPEAPQAGTLYRTLFLAAFLLFIFTFVVNTFAELVRQRLRTRYSQL